MASTRLGAPSANDVIIPLTTGYLQTPSVEAQTRFTFPKIEVVLPARAPPISVYPRSALNGAQAGRELSICRSKFLPRGILVGGVQIGAIA